jgi:hypothetical protein
MTAVSDHPAHELWAALVREPDGRDEADAAGPG